MTIALVVHPSLPGGDDRIAQAVADGLSARLQAVALPVHRAPRQLGAETGLLVVGGSGDALHDWLTELSVTVPCIPAAAWDARASREERLLRLRGFDLVAPAEHLDGGLERARSWGARLGELVSGRVRAYA